METVHGPDDRWRPDEDPWAEAAARVQADRDDEVRAEAREALTVEAARTRLADRTGAVRVLVRCGVVLEGSLDGLTRVDGHLVLMAADGAVTLVPTDAIVALRGSRPTLRDELARTADAGSQRLSSWLRAAWSDGRGIRVLDASGRWWRGPVTWVAADHVEVQDADGPVVVPFASAQAWRA